jgi:hypothetical protein
VQESDQGIFTMCHAPSNVSCSKLTVVVVVYTALSSENTTRLQRR